MHWPFCAAKCPYCDFNSHVAGQIDQARWANALAREIRRVALQSQGRLLSSIFFGGGTPSLMLPETVETVLTAARGAWSFANDIEITLEANPSSVEAGRFRAISQAGVNRVSLGVQSLRNMDLRRLGRLHDANEARAAIETARQVFDRVSFDLIYARQDQTIADWRIELAEALTLGVDHLSLYQLTIEQGTAFGDRFNAGRLRGLPDEDLAADLYEETQKQCLTAGFETYEVSNHARPGARSRHNMIYWHYGDWAGVGPGAHGRLSIGGDRWANSAISNPASWLAAAEAGNADQSRTRLTPQECAAEYLMMGLRICDGVSIDRLLKWDKQALPEDAVQSLGELGMIQRNDANLQATSKGRLMLNAIIRELLP